MRSGLFDREDVTRDAERYVRRVKDPRTPSAALRGRATHRGEPRVGNVADVVDQARRLAAAAVPARARSYHYSNVGYELLGLIAAPRRRQAVRRPLPRAHLRAARPPAHRLRPPGTDRGTARHAATCSRPTARSSTRPTGIGASAPTPASSPTRSETAAFLVRAHARQAARRRSLDGMRGRRPLARREGQRLRRPGLRLERGRRRATRPTPGSTPRARASRCSCSMPAAMTGPPGRQEGHPDDGKAVLRRVDRIAVNYGRDRRECRTASGGVEGMCAAHQPAATWGVSVHPITEGRLHAPFHRRPRRARDRAVRRRGPVAALRPRRAREVPGRSEQDRGREGHRHLLRRSGDRCTGDLADEPAVDDQAQPARHRLGRF